MTWIKQNENSYIHDTAPFSIIKQNEIWYVVDSRDQSKAVPYDDIFNNPVYNIDFSDKTLLAKHFRAEGVNTPGTPGFSFQGDINSGLYRISEDKIGFSAGGVKQGEFGVGYGGFTGNLIQLISSTTNYSTTINTATFQNINSGSGVIWETSIIPKLPNSKFLVIYKIQSSTALDYFGFKILNKINSGGIYSAIYIPRLTGNDQNATDFGNNSGTSYAQNIIFGIHSPSYNIGDTLIYKVMGSSYSPTTLTVNTPITGTGTNSGHSEAYIMEIAQ